MVGEVEENVIVGPALDGLPEVGRVLALQDVQEVQRRVEIHRVIFRHALVHLGKKHTHAMLILADPILFSFSKLALGPFGRLMMTPFLGFWSLCAMSSNIITMMFSSGTPWS